MCSSPDDLYVGQYFNNLAVCPGVSGKKRGREREREGEREREIERERKRERHRET